MKSLIKHSKSWAACGLAATFLAVSTLSYGQDANAPAAPPPDSGWPQAGNNNAGPNAPAPNQPSANPYGQPSANPYGQPPAPYGQPQQQQQPYGGGVYNQPSAPPPVPAQLELPAGTYVTARLNTRLASDRNHDGDAFTATLAEPVVVNGIVVAEPGQTITGQVVEADKVDGAGKLVVQLTDLPLADGQRAAIQTQLISRKADRFRGNDAGIVAGSTAAGAVIGGAVGYGTGAAVGAGLGALVSLGAVLTHGHASVLYPEEVLTFRVQQPVVISTTAAPQAFRNVQPGEYNQGPAPYLQAGAYAPPPVAPAPLYAYGYPAYGYSPYFWGPSVGLYFGSPFPYHGYYGRPYFGGRYYAPGFRGGYRR